MAKADHYVGGIVDAPQNYELRINGEVIETSANNVDLYWKCRRAVNGNPGVTAEVQAISGFYSSLSFVDEHLKDWERT